MSRLDRRRVLAAAGSAIAAALAGCPDDGGSGTETPSPTTSPRSTPTDGATPTGTDRGDAYKQRSRAFLGLLAEGSFEDAHARFSPAAAEEIPLDRLRSAWSAQEEQLGPFQSITAMERADADGTPRVVAVLTFENGRLRAIFSLGEAGITGFLLRPVAAEWTPPDYADDATFSERTLAFSATDGCSLGATLTVPDDAAGADGDATVPGVVIVHGQGPMDRDGTVGPNATYKDLAWGLATRGIAVLRYDKRTDACDVNTAEITIDDAVTEDALTAIERLRGTDAVAADDVVVVGHSTGGTLTPRIATRDGNLAGIAMLAALARPAHEAIVAQNEFIAGRDGTVTEAEERQLERIRALAERIRTLDIADDETAYLGGDEYWRTLQEYDHDAVASDLATPQLYLQGGRDWQVTVEEDLAAWQEVLDGKGTVSFETYDALNHHFMPGEGTPSQTEYFRENHVAEAVVTDLAGFAERVTGPE